MPIIHRLSATDTLNDLRFACKSMASILSAKDLSCTGRFPMRRVTEKVREGTVTVHELRRWHPRAVELLRKPN